MTNTETPTDTDLLPLIEAFLEQKRCTLYFDHDITSPDTRQLQAEKLAKFVEELYEFQEGYTSTVRPPEPARGRPSALLTHGQQAERW